MRKRYKAKMSNYPLKQEHKVIFEWIRPHSSVLDLGCGNGELLSALVKEKHVHGQGIEIDEQVIYDCVAKGLNVFQQDIDTGLAEYGDGVFDYVILYQSLQQVRKPDFVLKEALRVGKKVVVGFPNFAHYKARFQILFSGKVPVTPALPYEWYSTPNLHFLSISDFIEYCKEGTIEVEDCAFIKNNKRMSVLPNLFAETGIFLLSTSNRLTRWSYSI